ncbi:hypothetical protein [Gimesia fumaroli]|uniref:Uncharacterized protein n=1 Tax=Gimesia fumaroli TaxID=2527976 RepID=A0A518ILL4_9PLAN|nr:hypothetical protein [Gimesia fumaroli]QDV53990.1 hypothetical protein Enr17x_60730 [Gimesia fumaroli]
MKLNLKNDAKKIYQLVKKRVRDYPIYINRGPGEDEDPISQITLGYSVDQAGWIALVFDTRPDSEPDGEWNSYIEENQLEFPKWAKAVDAFCDKGEPIELILPDGNQQTLGEDDDLAEVIGKVLKEILLKARKEKLFKDLPIAKSNMMGVEDQVGAYGWPDYDDRFKLGWIRK